MSRRFHSQSFFSNQIAPAIAGKTCPICLNRIDYRGAAVITACLHAYCMDCIEKWSSLKRNCPLCNSKFNSLFFKISLSSLSFRTLELAAIVEGKKVICRDHCRTSTNHQSVIRRAREELSIGNKRTRALPRRRLFGHCSKSDIVRERVMRWRASIYERRLEAVPCAMRDSVESNVVAKSGDRERILQKIEPWIRRELQAITEDPDPSIIVHVATSIFISSVEEKCKGSKQSGLEDKLKLLRPFLLEKTNMFWHELRCFAESSFNMDTYDTVVEYIRHNV